MTRTGYHFPGHVQPGRDQPGMPTPSARMPGEQVGESVTANIDVTEAAVERIGSMSAPRFVIESVTVDADVYGFDFQVAVDGVELFDAPQSPSSTDPETFEVEGHHVIIPDDKAIDADVEVVDPSTSDEASADVTLNVLVDDG